MNTPPLDADSARLHQFCHANILCIGDVMLDRYIYGQVSRVSQEAPIPVLSCDTESEMLGGAGNLARNIAALGAQTRLIGVVGADAEAESIRHLAKNSPGLDVHLLQDTNRPTTLKSRYIAHGQQLLRADREQVATVSSDLQQDLIAAVDTYLPTADIVVLSDYAKGVLSETVIRHIAEQAGQQKKRVLVDPKRSDFSVYANTYLIKPNASELAQATGLDQDDDTQIAAAAQSVLQKTGIEAMLVSRSEKGVILVTAEGAVHNFPAKAREVFDVSGAGDTVVATMAVALAAGVAIEHASELANLAAGIVVARTGTSTCSIEDLSTALNGESTTPPADEPAGTSLFALRHSTDISRLQQLRTHWQQQGLRVGFTNGCFDLLHPGHISLLSQAAGEVDRLIVGLNSDGSVRALKGPERPVQNEADRACVLLALQMVDAVCVFDEETPLHAIQTLRPDVLVKGEDWALAEIVGADDVKSWGGRVYRAKLIPDQSTTGIVNRLTQKSHG